MVVLVALFWLPIGPDAIAAVGYMSELVKMVTPTLPSFAKPIVRPDSVTVTEALGFSVAVAVVIIMYLKVGASAVPVIPPLNATAGVGDVAKKFEGYVKVILLLGASLPPAVEVNAKVAAAELLPTTRSADAIVKEALVTWPPIVPDAAPTDGWC